MGYLIDNFGNGVFTGLKFFFVLIPNKILSFSPESGSNLDFFQ